MLAASSYAESAKCEPSSAQPLSGRLPLTAWSGPTDQSCDLARPRASLPCMLRSLEDGSVWIWDYNADANTTMRQSLCGPVSGLLLAIGLALVHWLIAGLRALGRWRERKRDTLGQAMGRLGMAPRFDALARESDSIGASLSAIPSCLQQPRHRAGRYDPLPRQACYRIGCRHHPYRTLERNP